jgi:hypothetical protein
MGLGAAVPVARDVDQVDGRAAALLAAGLHGAVLRDADAAENAGQNRQRRQQPPGRRIIWLPLQQSTGQPSPSSFSHPAMHLRRTHTAAFFAATPSLCEQIKRPFAPGPFFRSTAGTIKSISNSARAAT